MSNVMTNLELKMKLYDILENHKNIYMWGTFGRPVTESLIVSKSKQYPTWYTTDKQKLFRSLIGKGYYGFDCVNLIKGILWGWDKGNVKYNSNGVPDVSANGMISKCLNVTTDFKNIEIGEAVWLPGHIGVYVGDNKVIESSPKWSNNVQITACLNRGKVPGLNGRTWVKHGKIPYITYISQDMTITEMVEYLSKTTPQILGDKALWMKKATEDTNIYWLIKKTVAYITSKR